MDGRDLKKKLKGNSSAIAGILSLIIVEVSVEACKRLQGGNNKNIEKETTVTMFPAGKIQSIIMIN